MSERSITNIGKIAIGMAITAILLSITATLITYFRFGKINVMPLMGGLTISLLVIFLVTNKRSKKS